MKTEIISVGVTFGSRYKFYLRMLSLAEEQERRQQTFGLTDKETQSSDYERNVNLLADLSEKMPEGLFPNKPKETPEGDENVYIESFASPRAAIEAFFAEISITKERIADFAVRGFFVRLQPDVDFL